MDAGAGLPVLYGFAAVAAVIVGGLSFVFAAGTRQLPLLLRPASGSGKRAARWPRRPAAGFTYPDPGPAMPRFRVSASPHRGDAAGAQPPVRWAQN